MSDLLEKQYPYKNDGNIKCYPTLEEMKKAFPDAKESRNYECTECYEFTTDLQKIKATTPIRFWHGPDPGANWEEVVKCEHCESHYYYTNGY